MQRVESKQCKLLTTSLLRLFSRILFAFPLSIPTLCLTLTVKPRSLTTSPTHWLDGDWRSRCERLLREGLTSSRRWKVLVLVGRRGWENENVIDILERADILRGHVIEAGEVSDNRMQALVANARAMLMPSFAEGFGMPVVEALAAGVPVICSDIIAHREVGGDAPDYLDPLDGLGWMRAICAYAQAQSPERAAQLARIGQWRAPTWRDYFDIVTELIEEVTASVP